MKLRELLVGVPGAEVTGDADVEINDLAFDSRRVRPGTLFFCVRGGRADGHQHAADALRQGAAALVVERDLDVGGTQVRVADSRAAMAPIAARFWDDPTTELAIVGITGTNGKTTTAFLARHVLEANGVQAGLLGTVKRVIGGVEEEVERTTPEAIELQQTFRRMLDAGDRACVMEVSSHALTLERAGGIHFDLAVFTNLTQDHLDFHADMEDYFQAKRFLFTSGQASQALVNVDDPYGERLAGEIECLTFSARGAGGASYRALGVSFDLAGSQFRCAGPGGEVGVRVPLPGHFNVENALAALGATHVLGIELEAAARALSSAERVPGRFEPIDEGQPYAVIVDYAHTPDSLENVLEAARLLTEGRLICVFGCGGDRDRKKRPMMGAIGARLADLCVITSDNPRSEDPGAIIREIVGGIPERSGADGPHPVIEPDRRAAIALALGQAAAGDTIVIAGKGHEQGQEFEAGRKVPFDDREVARVELRRLRSGHAA
jgi:UDP-N-acetylmuramoyl-L-alanyl-D-glutamate--2,6-diaminopimelate ligase